MRIAVKEYVEAQRTQSFDFTDYELAGLNGYLQNQGFLGRVGYEDVIKCITDPDPYLGIHTSSDGYEYDTAQEVLAYLYHLKRNIPWSYNITDNQGAKWSVVKDG